MTIPVKDDDNGEMRCRELLEQWLRTQARTNPALALKQAHLVQALRAKLGSDLEVVHALNTIFGITGESVADADWKEPGT